MNKIKICQFSSVHPASDTRVFHKECKSLVAAGYDVTLIARDKGEPNTVEGVKIIPFHLHNNRFKRILFSPFQMLGLTLKQKAALYHFHDPELVIVGMMLKLFGKKVIYDVHEDFPKQMLDKSYLSSPLLRKAVSRAVRAVERFGTLFFNHIITATPSIAKNFSPKKTTVVRNVPLLELIHSDAAPEIEKKKPVIIYAGVLSRARGLVEIVRAMEHIGSRAGLWLLGGWENAAIEEQCRSLEGWKYVRFFGMKPQAEAYAMMNMADIGIVNFFPLANHVEALPNKIFEYMALGLPLVISNFPFWQENFDACALFADPHNPKEIARQITTYLDNQPLRQEKGQKGKELIDNGFSWEQEQSILTDLYNRLSQ